ncbi:MAG: hypothetical protein JRI36_13225, partial [Deltaproteobacteria bacterium]|nr:hypothetical protein [Deltaproteobacteria bacterium]
MKRSLNIIIVAGLLTLLFTMRPLAAQSRQPVVRDTNGDGKVDQVAHFGVDGDIVKLEYDADGDGVMDTFQYYAAGQVVRVERDTDQDGLTDTWDYLSDGKRKRYERVSSKTGKPTEI